MIRTLRCAALFLAVCTGHAAAQAENTALSDRIVAGLNAVWPQEIFEVRFEGCSITVRQEAVTAPEWITIERWWLADYETHPSRVLQDHQRMGDGEKTWVTTNVVFPLKPAVSDLAAEDMNRLRQARDAIGARTERGGILRWLGLSSFEPFEALRQLDRQRVAGHFGPVMARNTGSAFLKTDIKGTLEITGLMDGPPGFVFRDDVRDGILTDLHAHATTHCP